MTEANTNQRAGAEAKIEISLSRLSQLFGSLLDSSPFHERDLDPDAEEYIVGWARGGGAPRAAVSCGPFASGSATELGRYGSRPVNP